LAHASAAVWRAHALQQLSGRTQLACELSAALLLMVLLLSACALPVVWACALWAQVLAAMCWSLSEQLSVHKLARRSVRRSVQMSATESLVSVLDQPELLLAL
jgi:hypothetical protein